MGFVTPHMLRWFVWLISSPNSCSTAMIGTHVGHRFGAMRAHPLHRTPGPCGLYEALCLVAAEVGRKLPETFWT